MKQEDALEKAKTLEEIAEFLVTNYENIPSFDLDFSSFLSE